MLRKKPNPETLRNVKKLVDLTCLLLIIIIVEMLIIIT